MKIRLLTIILIIIVLIPGCITINDSEKEYRMIVIIANFSTNNEEITMVVLNSKNVEIFNSTFEIQIDEHKSIKNITKDNGKYTILAFMDENRTITNSNINVGKDYSTIHLRIYNNQLKLFQEMT